MTIIGIDTNVLITYRLKRNPGFDIAFSLFEDCLEGKSQAYLPLPALLETEWVLRSFYKQPKEEVIQFFEELLLIDNLLIDTKEEVKFSLNLYKNSSQVSFTDCVIIKQIQNQASNFLTFDQDLEKLFKET